MNSSTKEIGTCPCGSKKNLAECCELYLSGKKQPETAEQLMRARYSAFVLNRVDFILDTHHSKTRNEVKREEIEEWSKRSEWLGLSILNTENGRQKDEQGVVSFHARYKTDGKVNEHREHALFERENGKWRFLDAQAMKTDPIVRNEPKLSRNDPCPCGSGKKYKKCCAAS
ncbi:MAG: hypothetical protein A3K03_13685 [Bdellovibrionales bacterium RIFOXYD1_FULL_44_7]|nr:MAG: hypothetical protein A3K03_13685 [Bdellovibrionales bacterium RIFOXYD1_FULL_44_7]